MKNSDDRFGMPEENLIAAKKWIGKKARRKYPFCAYVPTRKEVATLPPEQLRTMLVGWMCHSPTEIIPSRTQIEEVRAALRQRVDADEFVELIKMCAYYISYSA